MNAEEKINIRIDVSAFYDVVKHRKPKFPKDKKYMKCYYKWRKYYNG